MSQLYSYHPVTPIMLVRCLPAAFQGLSSAFGTSFTIWIKHMGVEEQCSPSPESKVDGYAQCIHSVYTTTTEPVYAVCFEAQFPVHHFRWSWPEFGQFWSNVVLDSWNTSMLLGANQYMKWTFTSSEAMPRTCRGLASKAPVSSPLRMRDAFWAIEPDLFDVDVLSGWSS